MLLILMDFLFISVIFGAAYTEIMFVFILVKKYLFLLLFCFDYLNIGYFKFCWFWVMKLLIGFMKVCNLAFERVSKKLTRTDVISFVVVGLCVDLVVRNCLYGENLMNWMLLWLYLVICLNELLFYSVMFCLCIVVKKFFLGDYCIYDFV